MLYAAMSLIIPRVIALMIYPSIFSEYNPLRALPLQGSIQHHDSEPIFPYVA